MAYANAFQPSWRFNQPRQFSYEHAFQPSWMRDQPRQTAAQAPPPVSLPANSAQARSAPPDAGPVVPFDAALTNANNTADLNYQNTLAAIAARQPIIQREFGYNDQGEIDPNNPFSKAQLLQRAYQQTKSGTGNQYASRGQLYSGALQRAQNENQFNYQAQDAQLRGSYSQQLAELAQLRAQAANDRNNARSSAYWDWVMGQIQDRAAAPVTAEPDVGGVAPVAAPDGSFASYQGTPVEDFLRAMYAQSQQPAQSMTAGSFTPPPGMTYEQAAANPYGDLVAADPFPRQPTAAASGLGALVGRVARRGRR